MQELATTPPGDNAVADAGGQPERGANALRAEPVINANAPAGANAGNNASSFSERWSAAARMVPSSAAAEVSEAADAAHFIRGASLDSGPNGSRLSVLMVDDRLGRIALRMVDRAGLIRAAHRSFLASTTAPTSAARIRTEVASNT